MIKHYLPRLAKLPKRTIVIAMTLMATLALASPALATPKGDFAPFAQCPLKNPAVNLCLIAQSESGEFKIGTTTVPITKTITLQGGIIANEETGAETFVAAANGESLSKTALPVPGGLLGIIAPESWPKFLQEIFNNFINEGITGVTSTAELVGTPSINRTNLLFQEGIALSLPVRVHLNNAFLGSECFVGSKAHPVTLNLTSGTTSPPAPNKPISGKVGEIEIKDEGALIVIKNNTIVDNSFSAPGAEGCGGIFSFLVDPVVNAKLGLPAAAGHNTAILSGTLKNALASAVKASE